MRSTLLFLLILIAGTGYSQELSSKKHYTDNRYWFPYFENGKTGWINPYGGGHIPPSSITAVNYPFVSTVSGSVGIIDSSGRLLLDTIYTLLNILSNEHSLYDYDPLSDTLFNVHDGVISSTGRKIGLPGYHVKFHTDDLIVFKAGADWNEWPQNPADHRIYSIRKGAWLPQKFESVPYAQYEPIVATLKKEQGKHTTTILIGREGEMMQEVPFPGNEVWIWPYDNNYEYELIQHEVPLIVLVTPETAYIYHRNKLIDQVHVVNEQMEINQQNYQVTFPAKSKFPVKEPMHILMDYNRTAQIETTNGTTAYDLDTGDTLWHSEDSKLFFSEYDNVSVVTRDGRFGMYTDWRSPLFPLLFDSVIRMEGNYYTNFHTSWVKGRKAMFKTRYNIALQDSVTGKFALADSALQLVTSFEIDTIYWKYPFNDYETVLVKNGLEGIADKNCKIIIPAEYDTIGAYRPNDPYEKERVKFILKKGKETVVAGPDGKVIWKGSYPVANVISDAGPVLIEFGEPEKRGVMQADGTLILEPGYLEVTYAAGNLIVRTAAGTGIRDLDGKEVLPAVYSNIQPVKDTVNFYLVFDQQEMEIFNAAEKRFIGGCYQGPDLQVVRTGRDTLTVYTDFRSEFSFYQHKNTHAVIHPNGAPILPLHNSRIGNVFRCYDPSEQVFYLTDINGQALTGKYDYIAQREELFSPEGEFLSQSCKSRYFVLTRKDTFAIFDAWSGNRVEKVNVPFFLTACDTDSTYGVVLIREKDSLEIYSSDLQKRSPLKFDRYDQDGAGIRYSANEFFMSQPVFYLYRGTMRYTFDRRTNTLSDPVDTENDVYDIDGRLVVENYDSLEKFEYVFNVRKGGKTYWFTEDRFLFHITEEK